MNLDLLQGKFPIILKDNIGNEYNFFGEIVTGSDEGKKLAKPTQFISYWFAWAAFYPETELH